MTLCLKQSNDRDDDDDDDDDDNYDKRVRR